MSFIITTVLLAILLTVFSFAIGIIPIVFVEKVKSYKQRFIQLSIGILLSTIFAIIIPEGLEILEDNEKKKIGIYIILGFAAVYIIEEYVHSLTMGSHGNNLNESLLSYHQLGNFKLTFNLMLNNKVTFPLFIHGLSDGLTLGFITISDNKKISAVIILATIIHKIPAIISLVLILILKQNRNKIETLGNLWWFAVSTPIGYVVTSIILKLSGVKGDAITGKFLIASAGSLIFALIQTFQDDHHSSGNAGNVAGFDISEPYSLEFDEELEETKNDLKEVKIGMFLLGCFIPWIISLFIHE
ncbi:hypothetical protein QEN19_004178 [Hanseniaspora menglaensis]